MLQERYMILTGYSYDLTLIVLIHYLSALVLDYSTIAVELLCIRRGILLSIGYCILSHCMSS